VLAITLMAITRHSLRGMYLQPHLDVRTLAVNPQWGMFGIFVVLLAAGLAVVGWMVWQFYKAGQPQKAAVE
jgi:hypothetical protein